MSDAIDAPDETPRTVDGQILRVVRDCYETDQNPVRLSNIVAVVAGADVPRGAVVRHVARLQRWGELYAVRGGFKVA